MSETIETTEKKDTPKKILVAVVSQLATAGVDLVPLLGADIASRVANFYETLKTTQVRGLPAAERLANVEVLINSHFETMPSNDSPERGAWNYDLMKLLQRKDRIEREIREGGAHPEPKSKRVGK